jgi:hypothetical protein
MDALQAAAPIVGRSFSLSRRGTDGGVEMVSDLVKESVRDAHIANELKPEEPSRKFSGDVVHEQFDPGPARSRGRMVEAEALRAAVSLSDATGLAFAY